SRRRHTRSYGDWSSDVCSSDLRLNVVLVGSSSRARKGTSWAVLRRVFERADPEFFGTHVLGGLASGEGLVAAVAAASDGPDPYQIGRASCREGGWVVGAVADVN